jgi:hypothetical protein
VQGTEFKPQYYLKRKKVPGFANGRPFRLVSLSLICLYCISELFLNFWCNVLGLAMPWNQDIWILLDGMVLETKRKGRNKFVNIFS